MVESSGKKHLPIVNMPVTIRGWTGNYLCNVSGDDPCFFTTNRLIGEHWMVLPSGDYYIFKSFVDGRNLAIGPTGFLRIVDDEGTYAQWIIMKDPKHDDVYYLMNCYTNKNLQCNNENKGFTANTNKLRAEAMVVEQVVPDTRNIKIPPRH